MTDTMSGKEAVEDVGELAANTYWFGSRLAHHGWRLGSLSAAGFVADTPQGRLDVRADSTDERSLGGQFCRGLARLASRPPSEGVDHLHRLSVMLRLRQAARRPSKVVLAPWPIPGCRRQPSTAVRVAYWLACTLTDDYGWVIEAVSASGVTARPPGHSRAGRYGTRPYERGTTAAELTDHIAALTDRERDELHRLVTGHVRARSGRGPYCYSGRGVR